LTSYSYTFSSNRNWKWWAWHRYNWSKIIGKFNPF